MRTIYTPSTISPEEEQKLWDDAIIVFDASALLDFYFLTPDFQGIMSEIMEFMYGRIWIPAQVYYEFCKNYKSARTNPLGEKYKAKDILDNKFIDNLKIHIKEWEQDYYHPYLNSEQLKKIKQLLTEFEPKIDEVKRIVEKEYRERKKEIQNIENNDSIKNSVDSLQRGTPFSFKELKDILLEGDIRYSNQIPPGYKDSETKEGIRKYGDLIIWKEIIRKSKEVSKDIIFVSNDVKPDWRIVEELVNKKTEKQDKEEIGKPRRELLTEFEEETGQHIWFYQTSEFIRHLEERYTPDNASLPFYGKLGQVRDVLERREYEHEVRSHHTDGTLLLRCSNCGELFEVDSSEFFFEWEGGYSEDREMGAENEYVSTESIDCPNCGHQIDLEFHVWEYPLGLFNYQSIEADGGTVEEPIDLSHYISFEEYEACHHCGEYRILNDDGLCDECLEEFNRKLRSDD